MAHVNLLYISKILCIFSFILFGVLGTKNYRIAVTSFKHSLFSFFCFDNSTVILGYDFLDKNIWRSDNEGTSWSKIRSIPKNKARLLIRHPFSDRMAFVLGEDKKHYYTIDRGLTWKSFYTEIPFLYELEPLKFNSANPNYIIYIGSECDNSTRINCRYVAYYTEDGFSTAPKFLKSDIQSCMFVKSSKEFSNCSDELVLCTYMKSDGDSSGIYLIKSEDWFSTYSYVNFNERPLVSLEGLGIVKTFIIAVIKMHNSELEMFVSKDGSTWNRAEFPYYHRKKLKENSYTIMESNTYSLQVDILTSEYPLLGGISFKSDISGIYYTPSLEHTNRNVMGYVDFEDIRFIDGAIFANVIENWKELEKNENADKKIQSKISYDNGNTWSFIKPPIDSECNIFDFKTCSLHLHSITDKYKFDRIFSSYAPGILIGMGSVGPYLKPFNECNLYISEDAGKTWFLSLEGTYIYEWSDHGSIIAAIPDEKTNTFYYSFNRGRTWETINLNFHVHPLSLMIVPSSRTGKFMLIATEVKKNRITNAMNLISIDLGEIYTRECILDKNNLERSDLEKWYSHAENDSKCTMGRKQYFWRRKIDRKCFIKQSYSELQVIEENCPCSNDDYECDYNFIEYDNKCLEQASHEIPPNSCKNLDDVFMAPSGYRKIPGNTCDSKRGIVKDEKIEISCRLNAHLDKIKITLTDFAGELINYHYLKKNQDDPDDKNDIDETIIVLTDQMEVHVSHDQGNQWSQILANENIHSIYQNVYASEQVYFFGTNKKAWITKNRCITIEKIQLPVYSHIGFKPEFHPDNKDWIIYTGCIDNKIMEECKTESYYSLDGGNSWSLLLSNTRSCSWIKTKDFNADKNLIYCELYINDSEKSLENPVKLVYSTDFFNTYNVLFNSITNYARFDEFIILGEYNSELKALEPFVSLNGLNFTTANFPSHYSGQIFTILDSSTKSIFLHVIKDSYKASKWGYILKSNSNGTDFVKSLDFVERNNNGFIDFERFKGLEGIIISNIVMNPDDVSKGSSKRLKSVITYNDGSEWSYITPPKKDSKGNEFCSGKLEKCSLNLHGIIDRIDFHETFSSITIPGLDFAIGNVGEYLDNYLDSNTFMTTDGGVTWREIQKGPHLWKFGDQGSIILLAKDRSYTDHFLFSLNMGDTWDVVYFPEKESILIYDITTVYSDTSRKFVLFSIRSNNGNKWTAIHIDFTMLTNRKCKLDEDSQDKNDFDTWSFKYPNNEDSCFFGTIKTYYRKKSERRCFIGNTDIKNYISKNCTCQPQDYECDYNYERASNGSCLLAKGLEPLNYLEECKKYNLQEYHRPTGYRRIPLTTCQGGKELDKDSTPISCSKEKEFMKFGKGLHGFWLYFVIISPFIMIIFSSYCMWTLYKDRFLGQIRLGEDERPSGLIQYPIMLLDKIAAVFFAIRTATDYIITKIISLFSGYSYRFNRRDSFFRSDYSALLSNSSELLYDDFEN
ncbi:hypothetical protein T552_01288 [Pneumocystis carinii B80]|uniref:VPS10 domain-containing protein n=1 Tax=Pneumocystis carinii (strain B80) TaxID=1408658 RepID=A0A0W4ZLS1_PNEC8|nr:hypothetical protein T552_01288 [Pneumocystis carinii B80]KTW29333.1 hypothetical protein T552_01288 [Pneumocystis carinii B80]